MDNMDDSINRKLYLIHEVYGVFPPDEIIDAIIFFKKTIDEFDGYIETLTLIEDDLESEGKDHTELTDGIRKLAIQRLYLIENLETFKDALNLYKESGNK